MPVISELFGIAAEKLESTPELRRRVAWVYVALRKSLSRVGIGLPAQKPRGIRKLQRLFQSSGTDDLPETTGPRVLVFSPRGWATHLLLDTLVARSLQVRGADVLFWTCGNDMPVCHITNINEAPPMPCHGCKQIQGGLLDTTPFNRVTSSALVDQQSLESIKKSVQGKSPREIFSQERSGIQLGEIVKDAISWFYLTSTVPDTRESRQITRDFLSLAELTLEAGAAIIDQFDPDIVFMLNGVFTEEGVVRNLCEHKGIPYVTYERGFGFNQFLFSRNQIANYFDLSKDWDVVAGTPLSPAEESELDEYLRNWRKGTGAVVQYWDRPEERESVIAKELGIKPGERVIVMFTNVVWDTALFGRDVAFSDMWDWISTTIGLVAENANLHLVIRVHPAEVKLKGCEARDRVMDRIQNEIAELPPNVSVIEPSSNLSSYSLVSLCDSIMVYTSTIGLEAAIEGKKVVLCGDTHYRAKGFTFDVKDIADLRSVLEGRDFLTEEPALISERARRYAHLFFIRHPITFAMLDEKLMGNSDVKIDSLNELRPGNYREVDDVCEFVLDSVSDLESRALVRD